MTKDNEKNFQMRDKCHICYKLYTEKDILKNIEVLLIKFPMPIRN